MFCMVAVFCVTVTNIGAFLFLNHQPKVFEKAPLFLFTALGSSGQMA